jgi:TolB-like protein/lipopolysaccharide biosynthesis regulator YciM
MPNKLSQFWKELKRRKVTRTITVYAAAAFVILELVSMSAEPFGLPEWTFVLSVILLSIGFIIAIIISWIYDIHPEGGMVITEPADKVKVAEIPKSSNSWKIASYISFVVIMGLIILNIIPRKGEKEIFEKTIAVLPFENDSQDQANDDFINGTIESILNNLCKIKELTVISRSSVEQFRNSVVPVPEMAKILNVNYLVEGSMQKQGDHIRMTIQLVDKNDHHMWSEIYDREIKGAKEYFELQSEIAQLVASELQVTITPKEKMIIESTPTTNIRALSLFRKAREQHTRYWRDVSNTEALRSATALYRSAVKEDSSFGQAYTGLAMAISDSYWSESWYNRDFSETENQLYKDSVLYLVEKALSHDPNLEEAYLVKGRYFSGIEEYDKAMQEFTRALEINPNYSRAYYAKSNLLFYDMGKWKEGLEYLLRAIELEKGDSHIDHLRELGHRYEHMGFYHRAEGVYMQLLMLTGDSIMHCERMAGPAYCNMDWSKRIYWCKKILEYDPISNWAKQNLTWAYLVLGEMDSAYIYAQLVDIDETIWTAGDWELELASILISRGEVEKANRLLDRLLQYRTQLVDANEGESFYNLVKIAGVYTLKGESDKAIEYIRSIDSNSLMPRWHFVILEADPSLEGIRSNPEFQIILNRLKSIWQEEHDKVEVWLEENELL